MKKTVSILISLMLIISICVLSVPVYSLTNAEMDKMQKTADFVASFNHEVGFECSNEKMYGYIREHNPDYFNANIEEYGMIWVTASEYASFFYATCPEAPKGFVDSAVLPECKKWRYYDASTDKYGIQDLCVGSAGNYNYKSRVDNKDGTCSFYYAYIEYDDSINDFIELNTGFEIKLRKDSDGITLLYDKNIKMSDIRTASKSSSSSAAPSSSKTETKSESLPATDSIQDSYSLPDVSEVLESLEDIINEDISSTANEALDEYKTDNTILILLIVVAVIAVTLAVALVVVIKKNKH